ncbi:MAG: hypothetical protein CL489_10395 [Acidobacteria bacterium]|nr:hypothetical protein [Acidobacteriota bacterium]
MDVKFNYNFEGLSEEELKALNQQIEAHIQAKKKAPVTREEAFLKELSEVMGVKFYKIEKNQWGAVHFRCKIGEVYYRNILRFGEDTIRVIFDCTSHPESVEVEIDCDEGIPEKEFILEDLKQSLLKLYEDNEDYIFLLEQENEEIQDSIEDLEDILC